MLSRSDQDLISRLWGPIKNRVDEDTLALWRRLDRHRCQPEVALEAKPDDAGQEPEEASAAVDQPE